MIIKMKWEQPRHVSQSFYAWRTHPAGQMNMLRASIKKFGILTPLVVVTVDDAREEYICIDGNARLKIARELELEKIPIAILDDRNIPDHVDYHKMCLLQTDAIALLAEPDEDALRRLLDEALIDDTLLAGHLKDIANPNTWELAPMMSAKGRNAKTAGNEMMLLAGSLNVSYPPQLADEVQKRVRSALDGLQGVTVS